ncbi:putative E3 Ubiquitin-Protein Ligase Hectd4 [Manis pentadactyla]|nr:putative E3 Ubiquitin-Protein Ligase Hectd4 [Manis pentadactyla]
MRCGFLTSFPVRGEGPQVHAQPVREPAEANTGRRPTTPGGGQQHREEASTGRRPGRRAGFQAERPLCLSSPGPLSQRRGPIPAKSRRPELTFLTFMLWLLNLRSGCLLPPWLLE